VSIEKNCKEIDSKVALNFAVSENKAYGIFDPSKLPELDTTPAHAHKTIITAKPTVVDFTTTQEL